MYVEKVGYTVLVYTTLYKELGDNMVTFCDEIIKKPSCVLLYNVYPFMYVDEFRFNIYPTLYIDLCDNTVYIFATI